MSIREDDTTGGDMSSDVTIGSLKIRVNVRRKNPQAPWPRWTVQLLDVDGAELTLDTIDISDSLAEAKRATLTRNLSPSTESGDACSCPDCDPTAYGTPYPQPADTPMGKKRRISDESDSTALHHPGGGGPFSMTAHGQQSPAWSDNLDEDAPPIVSLYGNRVEANSYELNMYGARDGLTVKTDEGARGYSSVQGHGGAGEPQRSQVRDYTDTERATLRAVDWPKKIKSNGLPTLWCHSCYLKKRLFKIVSPLSPKPSIVYFRHQQCNTSYHKGEGLPLRIVKLYQDYYRQRGAREQPGNANAESTRNGGNIINENGLRALHPAYVNGRQSSFVPPQPAAQIVNGIKADKDNIDPADVPIEESTSTQTTKSALNMISEA